MSSKVNKRAKKLIHQVKNNVQRFDSADPTVKTNKNADFNLLHLVSDIRSLR